MTIDLAQAQAAISKCNELRKAGKVEAVLRNEFTSRLRLIFPSDADETWINQYTAGAEAHTKVGTAGDKVADRFIDNLIGATTIEFEADLRISAKNKEGYFQVREHTAGIVRSGVPASQVRGVLSDTLEWYAYDVELATGVEPSSCTAEDVTLTLVQELKLETDDQPSAERLVGFVRKHLAREKSRPLKADNLTLDLGLESSSYKRCAEPLLKLVSEGRVSNPSIALATDLWSEFVDYLERDTDDFRALAYVDEVYLCMLARLLSANVLAEQAIFSDEDEIKGILDGTYFRDRYQLSNMVEQDYFGWLTKPDYVVQLIPIARDIQRDLYAYDFSYRAEEDLFGKLMAQLARRSQRKLLGQEWTPAWLSALLAERCLDNLLKGEKPQIIDMCCGSGSILAEVLKQAKAKFGFTDIGELHDVATGFDIDPLAVTLSKTTWVVTLATEIKSVGSPIVIPVYHADSLFAVTPVSASLPFPGEEGDIEISLDGSTIQFPNELLQPAYSDFFDRIVDWAYDEAVDAQSKGAAPSITEEESNTFISGAATATCTTIPEELKANLVSAVKSLVDRMAELALWLTETVYGPSFFVIRIVRDCLADNSTVLFQTLLGLP